MSAGTDLRYRFGDDYVYAGFPSTLGSGSYFTRLGDGTGLFDNAMATDVRLGILASSDKQEAAWQFVRLLLTRGGAGKDLSYGIPVLKEGFEEAVRNSMEDSETENFSRLTEADAQKLRDLVYGTEKATRNDKALLDIITGAANAYFEGHYSLDEAVSLIQSRASLYVAEQYG